MTQAISILCLAILTTGQLTEASAKIDFWNVQRKGTNFFDKSERIERFKAAKEFGAQVVRLAPNKWGNGKDFLLKDENLQKDLWVLKKVLDDANSVGLKVVITMLSLPDGRWKQNNNGVEERKIWQDFSAQEKAISLWTKMALALKGHSAVVGYNIRNEPSPEQVEPKFQDWYTGDYGNWYSKVKGSPADLNLFYRKVVKAIRQVDSETPIILDSGFFATPWAFKILEPISDDKTLYSFHMYEPYAYTSHLNEGKFKYPGNAPAGESSSAPSVLWNQEQLKEFLTPVSEWQALHKIPSNRIFVGEFGVFRTNAGAGEYMKDLIKIFDSKGWHWAFYSFREDTWAGMDYELGTTKPGWSYWRAIESGNMPGPDTYKPNQLSQVLKEGLSP
jgi:endoglucanase